MTVTVMRRVTMRIRQVGRICLKSLNPEFFFSKIICSLWKCEVGSYLSRLPIFPWLTSAMSSSYPDKLLPSENMGVLKFDQYFDRTFLKVTSPIFSIKEMIFPNLPLPLKKKKIKKIKKIKEMIFPNLPLPLPPRPREELGAIESSSKLVWGENLLIYNV